MTRSEMDELVSLYTEIEQRLAAGECSGRELARLFDEASRLQSGADIWINLNPAGVGRWTNLSEARGPTGQRADSSASS